MGEKLISNIAYIYNTETSKNIQLDSILNIDIEANYQTNYAVDSCGKKLMPVISGRSFSMEFNSDDVSKTIGLDKSNSSDVFDIQYVKFVQARKHKKKRINKKWLKRYGYKPIIFDCKDWNVSIDKNGDRKFVKII